MKIRHLLAGGLLAAMITGGAAADFMRFDASGVAIGVNLEVQTVAPIPLSASLPLLLTGALALGVFSRKSKA